MWIKVDWEYEYELNGIIVVELYLGSGILVLKSVGPMGSVDKLGRKKLW